MAFAVPCCSLRTEEPDLSRSPPKPGISRQGQQSTTKNQPPDPNAGARTIRDAGLLEHGDSGHAQASALTRGIGKWRAVRSEVAGMWRELLSDDARQETPGFYRGVSVRVLECHDRDFLQIASSVCQSFLQKT